MCCGADGGIDRSVGVVLLVMIVVKMVVIVLTVTVLW